MESSWVRYVANRLHSYWLWTTEVKMRFFFSFFIANQAEEPHVQNEWVKLWQGGTLSVQENVEYPHFGITFGPVQIAWVAWATHWCLFSEDFCGSEQWQTGTCDQFLAKKKPMSYHGWAVCGFLSLWNSTWQILWICTFWICSLKASLSILFWGLECQVPWKIRLPLCAKTALVIVSPCKNLCV